MILKEDITIGQTNRPPPALLPTLRGLPSTASEESVPWYRPPSMPPPARLSRADPAPWRVDPPPRYRVKKRLARFFPLAVALTWSSFLLGTTVNFIIESIILIATTHVRKGLFFIFKQILIPSYILIASAALCIVLYPIHHAIPYPGPATGPFLSAPLRYKLLKIARLALPLFVLLVQLVGVVYYLAIALTKAGPDDNTADTTIPLGNGHELKLDPKFPKEGRIWEEWFFGDHNVKLVVTAAILAILSSVLFTLNAVEGTYIHRVFTGDPPPRIRTVETRVTRWWNKQMAGGYDGEEGEEMMTEPRLTAVRSGEHEESEVEEGNAGGSGRRRFASGSATRLGFGMGGLSSVLKDRWKRKRVGQVTI